MYVCINCCNNSTYVCTVCTYVRPTEVLLYVQYVCMYVCMCRRDIYEALRLRSCDSPYHGIVQALEKFADLKVCGLLAEVADRFVCMYVCMYVCIEVVLCLLMLHHRLYLSNSVYACMYVCMYG